MNHGLAGRIAARIATPATRKEEIPWHSSR